MKKELRLLSESSERQEEEERGKSKRTVQDLESDNARLNKEARAEEERRKRHNTIQESKGNIRVFCRIRPLLGEEKETEGDPIRYIC